VEKIKKKFPIFQSVEEAVQKRRERGKKEV
jgi:hypothetical protein